MKVSSAAYLIEEIYLVNLEAPGTHIPHIQYAYAIENLSPITSVAFSAKEQYFF